MANTPTIIYTKTDEAPALATHSLITNCKIRLQHLLVLISKQEIFLFLDVLSQTFQISLT